MDAFELGSGAGLELARDQSLLGLDGRALRRAAVTGQKRRLLRGVYAPSSLWDSADDDARYLLRIKAVVLTRRTQPVLSHYSAARVWGLPILGRWPSEVHIVTPGSGTRGSRNGIVWHRSDLGDDEVVEVDGLLVTSRLRTMVDLARSTGFASAVATLDAGLRERYTLPDGRRDRAILKEELVEAVAALGTVRGCRPANVAAAFADGHSGSVGESASRASVHQAGLPAPLLQVHYPRPDGYDDIVDFMWEPQHHVRRRPLLGEFDGKIKYTRNQFMGGRSIEDVVFEEKVREDRLREPGRDMARWLWEAALSPARLRAKLLAAGLRPER